MLTVAQAREILHHIVDVNDPYNPKFLSFLNQVSDRLHKSGQWRGLRVQRELTIASGYITLEREWESILGVLHQDLPRPILSQMLEFVVNGPGYVSAEFGIGGWLVDQGENAEGKRVYKIGEKFGERDENVRCLLKRRFNILVAETDEVYPSNLGALKEGLHAVMMEDASDLQRAELHWKNSLGILNLELEEHHAGEKPVQQSTPDDLGIAPVFALN